MIYPLPGLSNILREERDLYRTDLQYRRFFQCFIAGVLVVCLYVALSSEWGDLDYYWHQMDTLVGGNIPYKDYVYEYPPLSIPFLLLPRLLSYNLDMYHVWFMFFAFVSLLVCLRYSLRIADLLGIDRRWVYLLVILTLVSANKFVFARYDIFPATFVVMSLYYYMKKDYMKAFVLMGCAAAIKLYP